MRINYIRIENFRNFKLIEVQTGSNLVLVGENKAGKSNLIHALRLVLDPSLSDLDRQLDAQDFWDGEEPFKGREIKVVIQLTDFADGPHPDFLPISLLSGPCLIQTEPHKIAQLTYLYSNTKRLAEPEKSDINDYEPKVYGGNDPTKSISIREIRKNIPIQFIEALRDIAADNRVWRKSPLRQLVELSDLDIKQLEPFADRVKTVSDEVLKLGPLNSLSNQIKERLEEMIGGLYAIDPQLGLNATTAAALQEDLRLYADGEKHRVLDRTSLGLQNALYLALLSLLVERQEIKRSLKEERFLPIVALEEPEAHLHPHLQRLVFNDFLVRARHRKQPVIISTHSPHLVCTAEIEDLILLRDKADNGCVARSAFSFMQGLDKRARKDLARFMDITKSEMLFSKGIIFVEGDVEALLVGEFAEILEQSLDKYGISICNVYGAQFGNVVTLASQFGIPWVVLTDGDPYVPVTGIKRCIDLVQQIAPSRFDALNRLFDAKDDSQVRSGLKELGLFVNDWTFEKTLIDVGLHQELKNVFRELGDEIGVNVAAGGAHIDSYLAANTRENMEKILTAIGDARWGKGRFAHRLLTHIQNKVETLKPEEKPTVVPSYIREGIAYIIDKVQKERSAL
jgi:putative ATP-dependent endonuclease of the OLD family